MKKYPIYEKPTLANLDEALQRHIVFAFPEIVSRFMPDAPKLISY